MWVAQRKALGGDVSAAAPGRQARSPAWTASSVSDPAGAAASARVATSMQRTASYGGVTTTTSHTPGVIMTTFPQPGSADSPISVKSRYGHYIGGEWVAPIKGSYFENISPVNGKPFTEIARGTAEDIEAALDAAHAAVRPLGPYVGDRARQHPQQDRGPDRGEPRGARRRRDLGQRQAGPRDAGRRPAAGRRPLPLLRGRAPRPGGHHRRDRREHRRLPLPRAARRRRRRSSRGTSRS